MNTTLKVQNVKCHGCANTIKSQLEKIRGVENVQVDVESGSLNVSYPRENTLLGVVETLKRLGYPLESDKNTLVTKTKSYVSCAVGQLT